MRDPGYSDVVNLGGGRPLSMNYLMEIVNKISNTEVNFNRETGNSSDVKTTMANSTFIQSLIGCKPETLLEDGIRISYEWAKLPDISTQLNNWVRSVQ
jgi:UDP-glucuronate 4-epimerase